MRNISFAKGEYYHVYNRGVDKRNIFEDPRDLLRFFQSMQIFNTLEPSGGVYVNSFKELKGSTSKLVSFIAYCLNQNHYHFILCPLTENGIEKFMHRISTGYTMFFNEKYERSGSLFQGRYKAVHIETNEQLLHTSVYVNINNRVHGDINKSWLPELPFSSFAEYQGIRKDGICDTSIVLNQFENQEKYSKYAESTLLDIVMRKEREKLLQRSLID